MLTDRRRQGGNRTTIRCRRCGQRNLGIDIWCSRCGSNLDFEGEVQPEPSGAESRRLRAHRSGNGSRATARPAASLLSSLAAGGRETADRVRSALQAERARRAAAAQAREQRGAAEAAARQQRGAAPTQAPDRGAAEVLRRMSPGGVRLPSVRLTDLRPPALNLPAIPGTARAVVAIIAVLVLATLAIVLTIPRGGAATVGGKGSLAVSLPNSAIPAAISPAESKSGLAFAGAGGCSSSRGCLRVTQQFDGLNAAVVLFSAGSSRTCATYLYKDSAGWHPINALCAAGPVTPMVGQSDTVRIASGCAHARDSASLAGGVVGCLNNGASVAIDGGPNYANGKLWWHLQKVGWMVQDYLQVG